MLFLLFLSYMPFISGQYDPPSSEKSIYHTLKFSRSETGTGHGTSYEISTAIQSGKRYLEFGALYSMREERLAGATIKYRYLLGTKNESAIMHRNIAYYLQYNLIYQQGTSYSANLVIIDDQVVEVNSEPGIIATVGHFAGMGSTLQLAGRMYLDFSAGLGFYQGSLDQVNGPGTWGLHRGNAGITYSLNIGLGYQLSR